MVKLCHQSDDGHNALITTSPAASPTVYSPHRRCPVASLYGADFLLVHLFDMAERLKRIICLINGKEEKNGDHMFLYCPRIAPISLYPILKSLKYHLTKISRLCLSLGCPTRGLGGWACSTWGPGVRRDVDWTPSFVETETQRGPREPARSSAALVAVWGPPLQHCWSLKLFILIARCLQDPLCFLELEPPFVSGPGAPISYNFPCKCIYYSCKNLFRKCIHAWSLSLKGSWWSRTPGL